MEECRMKHMWTIQAYVIWHLSTRNKVLRFSAVSRHLHGIFSPCIKFFVLCVWPSKSFDDNLITNLHKRMKESKKEKVQIYVLFASLYFSNYHIILVLQFVSSLIQPTKFAGLLHMHFNVSCLFFLVLTELEIIYVDSDDDNDSFHPICIVSQTDPPWIIPRCFSSFDFPIHFQTDSWFLHFQQSSLTHGSRWSNSPNFRSRRSLCFRSFSQHPPCFARR